jgi:hypothetical protein
VRKLHRGTVQDSRFALVRLSGSAAS